MIAPEIVRTSPRTRDPDSVVAVVAIREAARQWGLTEARRSLVGTYDTRPLPVTVRPETEEEAARTPYQFLRRTGDGDEVIRWLRLIVHHGPGDVMNLSGPLDPGPVVEELAAFEAFKRSQRWFSREGLEPGERVLVVTGFYRGDEADFHHRITPRDLAGWKGSEARAVAIVVEGMNRAITRLVLTRIAGPEVLEMMGETR